MMAAIADLRAKSARTGDARSLTVAFCIMVALLAVAPFVVYPIFLMQALCFALFACAFNLLIG
jgi:branched-chain amino acid transport system permease protein